MISCGRQSRKSRRAKPRAEGWWKSECLLRRTRQALGRWGRRCCDRQSRRDRRDRRPVGEIIHSPVKSMFCTSSSETFLGLPWHSSVISAARSRSQETASATPITLLSAVGTSICAQFMRGLAPLRGACACAPPACAAVKWLRPRDSPPFSRAFIPLQLQF